MFNNTTSIQKPPTRPTKRFVEGLSLPNATARIMNRIGGTANSPIINFFQKVGMVIVLIPVEAFTPLLIILITQQRGLLQPRPLLDPRPHVGPTRLIETTPALQLAALDDAGSSEWLFSVGRPFCQE